MSKNLLIRLLIPLLLLLGPIVLNGTIWALHFREPTRSEELMNAWNLPKQIFLVIPYCIKINFQKFPLLSSLMLLVNIWLLRRWFKKPSWKIAIALLFALAFLSPYAWIYYKIVFSIPKSLFIGYGPR